jgi:hypothetical protein
MTNDHRNMEAHRERDSFCTFCASLFVRGHFVADNSPVTLPREWINNEMKRETMTPQPDSSCTIRILRLN